MQKTRISLDVVNASASHNIGIELRLDNIKFFDSIISPGTHHIVHEFDEDKSDHYLYIVLKGKTYQDTKIDDQGNVIEDSIIDIKNICFDEINIDQIVYNRAEYIHDSNGTDPSKSTHKFYGHMGCNGHVQLKFSCPVYIWLLENM